MFISTDAIILKNTPYKESSVISRLFSKEQGKISVIFKGAKRNNKSIAAVIEPGNIVNITYYNKSTLKVAKEINLTKIYYSTREIVTHYYYTMAIISLLDKLCMEHQQYSDLYDLSIDVLEKINEQKIDIGVLFIYFLLHLNKSIGYEIMTIDQSDIINDRKLYNDDIINIIKQLNQTIDVLYKIDADIISKIDLINKLKIIIYKHMKHNIIDLNDINAIKMLKYIKDERTS